MAKRSYFKRAADARAAADAREAQPPPPPPPRSDAWRRQFVVGWLPDGTSRYLNSRWLQRVLAGSKGGRIVQASGNARRFNSETGRKAILKRWRKHPPGTYTGVRRDHSKQPKIRHNRAEVRAAHSTKSDGWHLWYDAEARQWWIRDSLGERTVNEQTALRYGGYLKRPSAISKLPTRYRGIDLDEEGWTV